jgi:hypothetical protein
MKRSILLLVLGFVFLLTCGAQASLYLSSGGKSFNINVVRRDFRPIYDARGHVFVSGNTARIEVRAEGYRSANRTIYLKDNVNTYHETVTLDDPTIFVNLKDSDFGHIANSSTSHFSQSLYQSNEFGLRARFPVTGFEKITSRDIDVRVNSMFAFLPRIYLNKRGDFWDLEVVLRRRDFSDFSNRIEILVNRTPEAAPAEFVVALAKDYAAQQILMNNERKEAYIDRLCSLAREINLFYANLDAEAKESISEILKDSPQILRELQISEKFSDLH